MQRINRIAAFVSVSFVLIFIAKINKAGLYTAYFKTLAEVEIRNSQDVAPDLLLNHDFRLDGEKKGIDLGGNGPTAVAFTRSSGVFYIPQKIASHYSGGLICIPKHHFFRSVRPRAPTA